MKEAWHLFKVRRALLASEWLCYASEAGTQIRIPQTKSAVASLLYVNAVSLLDEAIMARLTDEELEEGEGRRTYAMRIKMLQVRDDLLDYDVLVRIGERRDEIVHEPTMGASFDELDCVCTAIQNQLVAWGLVEDKPAYKLELEPRIMCGKEHVDWINLFLKDVPVPKTA